MHISIYWTSQLPHLQITVPSLYDHICTVIISIHATLFHYKLYIHRKEEGVYSESIHSCRKCICWNNLSLFCCHLQEILLVNLEEPPALLGGQIRGAPSLVEPDGGLVPLCDEEVHAAAAALHSHLQNQHHTVTAPGDSPRDSGQITQILYRHHKSCNSFQQPLQHFSHFTRL